MASSRRQRLGKAGEELAAHFLEELGYTVLQRNARLPEGELDLVVRGKENGTCIVFVEVKTRSVREPGGRLSLSKPSSSAPPGGGAATGGETASCLAVTEGRGGAATGSARLAAADEAEWPELAVTPAKQARLRAAALAYLTAHPELGEEWRLDVVAVSLAPGRPPEIVHYENAVTEE